MINPLLKRTFDIVAALLGLMILWPAGVLVAVIIKISSPGPVFYIQKRIGQHGKEFKCIKFRTMYSGAHKHGSVTTASDIRITRPGKYLRRFKLDEFPQLWNVLTGKMSFVGPRPDVKGYADRLEGENRKILQLRPGITGPASICFRNEESILANAGDPLLYNDSVIWPKKVEINKKYMENWSFIKDIGFILITIIPSLNRWFRLIEEPAENSNLEI